MCWSGTMTSEESVGSTDSNELAHPGCDMNECVGSPDDDSRKIIDNSDSLASVCQSCLDYHTFVDIEVVH